MSELRHLLIMVALITMLGALMANSISGTMASYPTTYMNKTEDISFLNRTTEFYAVVNQTQFNLAGGSIEAGTGSEIATALTTAWTSVTATATLIPMSISIFASMASGLGGLFKLPGTTVVIPTVTVIIGIIVIFALLYAVFKVKI